MGWESPSHWVIIAILVIALFGYKKLPDAARSIGRSLRIFKAEVKGMSEDDKAREAAKEAERDNKSDSAGASAVAPPVRPTVVTTPEPVAASDRVVPPVVATPPPAAASPAEVVPTSNGRATSGE